MTSPEPRVDPTETGRPPFWQGLGLNLLLPGSGFTYLGRPWWHLTSLLLTLSVWWLVSAKIGALGSYDQAVTGLPIPPEIVVARWGWSLLFLAPYGVLTQGYLRASRAWSPAGSTISGQTKKLLIWLHALVPALLLVIFAIYTALYLTGL